MLGPEVFLGQLSEKVELKVFLQTVLFKTDLRNTHIMLTHLYLFLERSWRAILGISYLELDDKICILERSPNVT